MTIAASPAAAAIRASAPKHAPLRVLIADDEPHIRQLLAAIVGRVGGQVVAQAGDGVEAVRIIGEARPDLAILDINMPGLRGDLVLKIGIERHPRMLGIMLTAQDSIDVVERCLGLGAIDYILKSNRAEQIYAHIARAWPTYLAHKHGGMAG